MLKRIKLCRSPAGKRVLALRIEEILKLNIIEAYGSPHSALKQRYPSLLM